MQLRTWRNPMTLALLCALAGPACGDGHEEPTQSTEAEEAEASPAGGAPPMAAMPVFVPSQSLGTPGMRQGGATRSTGDGALPSMEALVPERTGLTLEEHPVVYWYLSRETDHPLEFVLLDAGEAVTQVTLPKPEKAGVQRLAFAEHGIKLEPEVEYVWLIKLVYDPANPNNKLVGGGILRVAAEPELKASLAEPGASRPHLLASGGIWYDAVDALSVAIDKTPDDATPWNHRAHLFETVGLPEIPAEDGAAPGFEPK